MNKITILRGAAAAVFMMIVSLPLTVSATSYMPFFHSQDRAGAVMKPGEDVYLFHSGTDDIRKTVLANDVLVVYRIDSSCEVREVGMIQATAYIGETYLRGQVIKGEIRQDDIAKKGKISFLVISAGTCRK